MEAAIDVYIEAYKIFVGLVAVCAVGVGAAFVLGQRESIAGSEVEVVEGEDSPAPTLRSQLSANSHLILCFWYILLGAFLIVSGGFLFLKFLEFVWLIGGTIFGAGAIWYGLIKRKDGQKVDKAGLEDLMAEDVREKVEETTAPVKSGVHNWE